MRDWPVLVVVLALVAGCGTAPEVPSPVVPSISASGEQESSDGWEITVYYTAVEEFHDGVATAVTGCLVLDCSGGDDDLGDYPADFVQAVHDEGTGLTRSGRYLNWSYDVGYWLDSVARASDGGVLEPFVTAAADSDVLAPGTDFRISGCGRLEDGTAPPVAVCGRLSAAGWHISDEFTPGLGGARHIDAYIGPETGPDFTDSEWYLTLVGATLAIS
ncbi:hypothetical protein [Actinoplanes derwentensis]|uniref:Uncharacterized protein n=1 Tax=Actinoplanes derwentensis TaxID=113562 RepID=A0A1H1RHP4_9ACTN|nr:hypothetical protein [Actinoplanes derwentensis]GID89403.1 hypothetical protein Ade03nite_83270 [Actinoplanes derwentensis]SDS35076.1 hypothetical protein SAMN04489716_0589 [Actinoplanes derwentensis]